MEKFIYGEPIASAVIMVLLVVYLYFSGRNFARSTGNYLYYKIGIILVGAILMPGGYLVNDAAVQSGIFEGTSIHWDSVVGSYISPIAGAVTFLYGLLVVNKEDWEKDQRERE